MGPMWDEWWHPPNHVGHAGALGGNDRPTPVRRLRLTCIMWSPGATAARFSALAIRTNLDDVAQ